MGKEVKGKAKVVKTNTYESLKALYFSGKVKPSLNKMLVELENDVENLDLTLLTCLCLVRAKDFEKLSVYADTVIKLDAENAEGYYYKGLSLHHAQGKEQDAIKNFNESLTLEPENIICLNGKAASHLLLFTNYHLPVKLAEKHRDKGEESLLKIISLVEEKENPTCLEFLTAGNVSILIKRNMDAKKYYIKAVNAYEALNEEDKNVNVYKDIIKAQKACIKLVEKFTE